MQNSSPNPSLADQVLNDQKSTSQNKKDGLSLIVMLVLAVLTAVFLNLFIFQSYEVEGHSMEPTLQDRDRLVILKLPKTWATVTRSDYIPDRGRIIVFHKPDGSSDQLIKRVVGLPGDRVVVKNGKITAYNSENPSGIDPDELIGLQLDETFGNTDVTVGENEVFVVGDNRIPGASLDSRSTLGNVPLKNIVGELTTRYLPPENFQNF